MRSLLSLCALLLLAACQPSNKISQPDKGNPPAVVDKPILAPDKKIEFETMPKGSPIDQNTLVKQNNLAAFDLYKHISKTEENCFFSPYSVSTAFGLAQLGAAQGTETEIAKTLRWGENTQEFHKAFGSILRKIEAQTKGDKLQMAIANRFFISKGTKIKPEYTQLSRECYQAEAEEIDYAAPNPEKIINQWVEKQTKDRIKDLIPKGALSDAVMVLVNAIYFYGEWQIPFDPDMSNDEQFTDAKGAKNTAKTMNLRNWRMQDAKKTFRYTEDKKVQVLELPYEDHKASMIVVLPRENSSLEALRQELSAEKIAEWEKELKNLPHPLNLKLPKWKLTKGSSLKEPLKKMGMSSIFDSADFSRMIARSDLFVSDVIHKAFIEVSEKGTEAAAATAIIITATSTSVNPVRQEFINFYATRPFFYYIRDNATGSILFMGHLSETPQQ